MQWQRNENLKSFELRFGDQPAKFNALIKTVTLSTHIAEFVLMGTLKVELPQRISILAAASSAKSELISMPDLDTLIEAVDYNKTAFVVGQCRRPDMDLESFQKAMQDLQLQMFPKIGPVGETWLKLSNAC